MRPKVAEREALFSARLMRSAIVCSQSGKRRPEQPQKDSVLRLWCFAHSGQAPRAEPGHKAIHKVCKPSPYVTLDLVNSIIAVQLLMKNLAA